MTEGSVLPGIPVTVIQTFVNLSAGFVQVWVKILSKDVLNLYLLCADRIGAIRGKVTIGNQSTGCCYLLRGATQNGKAIRF